jgi:hypothetical protein
LLMAPFIRDDLANLNPHVRKLEDQSQSHMILRTKHRQGGFAVVPLATTTPFAISRRNPFSSRSLICR